LTTFAGNGFLIYPNHSWFEHLDKIWRNKRTYKKREYANTYAMDTSANYEHLPTYPTTYPYTP